MNESKRIEILAPAGSYDSLLAGVNSGCDAVYMGGTRFGARAFADNPDQEHLLRAIDYVHLHNKRIYLTVNTLIKQDELEELYQYMVPFYNQGLDGVIVQDIGAMAFIHEYFPSIPIHASTQMTLTMAEGSKMLEELGVTRLVPSRELSLEEIKTMRKHTKLELESFVHGALCYCYSGQCFMSSMIGGRSGNRGRCAQPCRMPYSLENEEKQVSSRQKGYLLSPKDMCTIDRIPDLIEAGINSFKIEGRMKRAEYTALTVSTYRKYVNLYYEMGRDGFYHYIRNNQKEYKQDIKNLMDLYNRGGFSAGYYEEYNGKNMMSMKRPNHFGVLVGDVKEVKGNRALIHLTEDIKGQDILEIRNEEEAGLYEYTVKSTAKKENSIWSNFTVGRPIKKGNKVYRTKNENLLSDLKERYLKNSVKVKLKGCFTAVAGKPASFTISWNEIVTTIQGDIVERALNQPMDKKKIEKSLLKINDTEFEFESLKVELPANNTEDSIFIPVGQLNEIRRRTINSIREKIVEQYRRKDVAVFRGYEEEHKTEESYQCRIGAIVSSMEQFEVVSLNQEINSVYLRIEEFTTEQLQESLSIHNKELNIYFVLPVILRKDMYLELNNQYVKKTGLFLKHELTGFLVKNYEELQFVWDLNQDYSVNKEIILDYNMYTLNRAAKEFWKSRGIQRFTSSLELNQFELKKFGCANSDLVVYGYVPVMVSAQCLLKNTKGCTKESKVCSLKDRYNKTFYVKNNCSYCYNIIYNGIPLSLFNQYSEVKDLQPYQVRMDFTIETETETSDIVKAFVERYRYNQYKELPGMEITKGHFNRGME